MKGWLLAACAAGAALASADMAGAQLLTPEEIGLNYAFVVGAAFSVNENLDNKGFVNLGVSWYGDTSADLGDNSAIGISGDWILVQRELDGKEVNLVPVLLNYKQYAPIGAWRVFVNFGIGILAATDDIPEMLLDEGANFGWSGGLGVDLSNHLFGQVRYIGGNNPGEDGVVSVQVGYRF